MYIKFILYTIFTILAKNTHIIYRFSTLLQIFINFFKNYAKNSDKFEFMWYYTSNLKNSKGELIMEKLKRFKKPLVLLSLALVLALVWTTGAFNLC